MIRVRSLNEFSVYWNCARGRPAPLNTLDYHTQRSVGACALESSSRLPPHEIPLPYLQLQCNSLATCPTMARFHLRLHFMDGNLLTYLQC
ncbi:hypothetical protein J6590_082992 [Homalodisca vitripennis]|nr:hypothetical protein J6590_082992 [Homalodisca vitripennis]